MGAGVIHLAVIPAHWREWVPAGVFFVVLALVQLGWAVAAWSRPRAWVLAAGIAVNSGAAVLWVNSCIAGPPVGPTAGHPEAVGAAGISVLLLQCYVVMGAAWSWLRQYEARDVPAPARAAVLMGAHTVVAGAVTLGLVATLHGHHHHGPAGPAEGHPHLTAEPPSAPSVPPASGQPALPVSDMAGAAPAATPAPDLPEAAGPDGHGHHHDGD